MAYRIQVDGRDTEVEIRARRPLLRLRIGDAEHTLQAAEACGQQFTLVLDGVSHRGWRCASGDDLQVRLNGRTYTVHLVRRQRAAGTNEGQEEIRASMPGVVVAVHASAGQAVNTGDGLLTLESMKLQMTIVASHAGVVAQVHVVPEAVFERGALLVSFARQEGSAE
ncbi:MAG: biotin/lipoyl-binding protein [Proteobacteria bacterium]|nr:biotin/lipoyl-binding protein [Pseudomonadota bacterium]